MKTLTKYVNEARNQSAASGSRQTNKASRTSYVNECKAGDKIKYNGQDGAVTSYDEEKEIASIKLADGTTTEVPKSSLTFVNEGFSIGLAQDAVMYASEMNAAGITAHCIDGVVTVEEADAAKAKAFLQSKGFEDAKIAEIAPELVTFVTESNKKKPSRGRFVNEGITIPVENAAEKLTQMKGAGLNVELTADNSGIVFDEAYLNDVKAWLIANDGATEDSLAKYVNESKIVNIRRKYINESINTSSGINAAGQVITIDGPEASALAAILGLSDDFTMTPIGKGFAAYRKDVKLAFFEKEADYVLEATDVDLSVPANAGAYVEFLDANCKDAEAFNAIVNGALGKYFEADATISLKDAVAKLATTDQDAFVAMMSQLNTLEYNDTNFVVESAELQGKYSVNDIEFLKAAGIELGIDYSAQDGYIVANDMTAAEKIKAAFADQGNTNIKNIDGKLYVYINESDEGAEELREEVVDAAIEVIKTAIEADKPETVNEEYCKTVMESEMADQKPTEEEIAKVIEVLADTIADTEEVVNESMTYRKISGGMKRK